MKTPDRIEINQATRYFLDNVEVDEATYRARHPLPESRLGGYMGARDSAYPYAADSLAVHPSQVAEARAAAEAVGVPTDFTPSGEIIWKSREHQRQYCQATGFINRDETWSGRGSRLPPESPKIRPRLPAPPIRRGHIET